jgi:uncharacterized membrane protein YjgN (DUF898 family)
MYILWIILAAALLLGCNLEEKIHIVLEIDESGLRPDEVSDVQEDIMEIIASRVKNFSKEANVNLRADDSSIVADFTGIDADYAKNLATRAGVLEFRMAAERERAEQVIAAIDNHLFAFAGNAIDELSLEGLSMSGKARFPFSGYLTSHGPDLAVLAENISKVQGLLDMPEIQDLIPRDLEFAWDRDFEYDDKLKKLYLLKRRAEMDNEDILFARSSLGTTLMLAFDEPEKFGLFTENNIDRQFAVVLDGQVIVAPIIREKISSDEIEITGFSSAGEANQAAIIIGVGALPVPVKAVDIRIEDPVLRFAVILLIIFAFAIACAFFISFKESKNREAEQMRAGAGENNFKISYRGDDATLFKIWISNLFLTICTLGIFYPWGRARMKKYLYSSTYLGEHNFEFHGTGKQMFFGLLKFLAVIVFLYVAMIAIYTQVYVLIPEFFAKLGDTLLSLLILIPYAPILALFIHGTRRYGMAKTSYRGIRFGYRGSKKSLASLMLGNALLTAVTFGIYYPWLTNNVRRYIYGCTRFGNIKVDFNGKGSSFFGILYSGVFLTIITFGIYYFWFKKRLFNFFYENMSFSKGEQTARIKSNATGRKFLNLIVGNQVLIMFTLGFGYPFAKARSMRFIADNLELQGNLDLESVLQTEGNYSDATGDAETDMNNSDFFDMDIF